MLALSYTGKHHKRYNNPRIFSHRLDLEETKAGNRWTVESYLVYAEEVDALAGVVAVEDQLNHLIHCGAFRDQQALIL